MVWLVDWSSAVCSPGLVHHRGRRRAAGGGEGEAARSREGAVRVTALAGRTAEIDVVRRRLLEHERRHVKKAQPRSMTGRAACADAGMVHDLLSAARRSVMA